MTRSLLDDPALLPFKLDLVGRRVLWLRLDAQQRRDAAFLVDRAVPANADGGRLPLGALLAPRRPGASTRRYGRRPRSSSARTFASNPA